MGRVLSQHSTEPFFVNSRTDRSLIKLSFSDIERNPQTHLFSSTRYFPGLYVAASQMLVGEKAKFVVPPKLGYGDEGNSDLGIPPGSWITMDVWLVEGDGKRAIGMTRVQ
mmetsp:Transcript_5152/g.19313  ORF Transcript_5152/g.19313 Transcript_5152/m.19313 type:complete len:110 (+) Transcript_5152:198-527(+)